MILVKLQTKMNFKRIITITIGTITIIGVATPVYIIASPPMSASGFCNRISNISSDIVQKVKDNNNSIESKRTKITKNLQERWTEQANALLDKRNEWDESRDEHFKALEEKFPNDPKKQTVIVFERAVEAAIVARRAAINKAIADYQQGVQKLKSDRKTAIDAIKTTYEYAITAAFNKAKSDCSNDANPVTTRQTFIDAVKAAKDKYKSDYQAIEKLSTNMDQLIAARKAAIEKAIQDFKVAMEKAKADFASAVAANKPQNGQTQKEKACTDSGGIISTSLCCATSPDFPNNCLIGACGCAPENSHQVKVCNCGEGKCFNGEECVAVQ